MTDAQACDVAAHKRHLIQVLISVKNIFLCVWNIKYKYGGLREIYI